MATWDGWVQEHAVVSRVVPHPDDPDRGEVKKDLRRLGGPLILRWRAPAGAPLRGISAKGDRAMAQAVEQLRQANRTPDLGGYLAWTIGATGPADKGPVLRAHPLADGLDVLGSADVLPLWAAAPDGSVLTQDGSIREPDPVWDCPGWLLEELGATKLAAVKR